MTARRLEFEPPLLFGGLAMIRQDSGFAILACVLAAVTITPIPAAAAPGIAAAFTPASPIGKSAATAEAYPDQSKVATHTQFGAVASTDPTLKKALVAQDLKGAS